MRKPAPKKAGRKKKKNLGGRPTVFTPATISKLEEAFLWGCNDAEACLFAGISMAAFYRYIDMNPDFKEKRDLLKENPALKARKTVLDNLQSDARLAFDYLCKKKKDEFGDRKELTGLNGNPLIPIQIIDDASDSNTNK